MQCKVLYLVASCLWLFSVVDSVSAIECYICISSSSWQNCGGNMKKMTCTAEEVDLNACVKMHQVQGNNTYFIRRCGNFHQCSKTKQTCKQNKECEVNCCQENLCNGQSRGANHVANDVANDVTTSYIFLFSLLVISCFVNILSGI